MKYKNDQSLPVEIYAERIKRLMLSIQNVLRLFLVLHLDCRFTFTWLLSGPVT